MDTVTAEQVREAVHAAAPEAPVHVWQTGGSTATVFVGTANPDTQRYWLAIGPGSYDWGEPWRSDFYLGDLYVGPDDDGEADPVEIHELEQLTKYVKEAQQ